MRPNVQNFLYVTGDPTTGLPTEAPSYLTGLRSIVRNRQIAVTAEVMMERTSVDEIREALEAAREAAAALDGCDISDIEEIIAPVEAELQTPRPNVHTLSTYLNSLAKSLRADPASRTVCLKIDAAMRNAGVPTHWEH